MAQKHNMPMCDCAPGTCHIDDSQGTFLIERGLRTVMWYDHGIKQAQCRALIEAPPAAEQDTLQTLEPAA